MLQTFTIPSNWVGLAGRLGRDPQKGKAIGHRLARSLDWRLGKQCYALEASFSPSIQITTGCNTNHEKKLIGSF